MRIKILIADDEPNILKMAGDMLEQSGYEVITASEGFSALEKARAEKPDLIILDRNMPGLDGIEVCARIRATSYLNSTPIIFLTARDEEKEVIEGLKEGANEYVTKPFNMEDLKDRIRIVLEKSKKL